MAQTVERAAVGKATDVLSMFEAGRALAYNAAAFQKASVSASAAKLVDQESKEVVDQLEKDEAGAMLLAPQPDHHENDSEVLKRIQHESLQRLEQMSA